jgi:hypothetical protein
MSPEEVIDFLDSISEREEYLDNYYETIWEHKTWKLSSIAIEDLDFDMDNVFDPDSQSLVLSYSKLNTRPPPIIVVSKEKGYHIIDGYHRVGAAILTGKKKLRAYLPADE